jgi:hypothetical protein
MLFKIFLFCSLFLEIVEFFWPERERTRLLIRDAKGEFRIQNSDFRIEISQPRFRPRVQKSQNPGAQSLQGLATKKEHKVYIEYMIHPERSVGYWTSKEGPPLYFSFVK